MEMETFFDSQVKGLYEDAYKIINRHLKGNPQEDHPKVAIPQPFSEAFFRLVDNVNLMSPVKKIEPKTAI